MDLKYSDGENAAVQTIEKFMSYLNSGNNAGLYNTIHTPHVRISGNRGSNIQQPSGITGK